MPYRPKRKIRDFIYTDAPYAKHSDNPVSFKGGLGWDATYGAVINLCTAPRIIPTEENDGIDI